MTSVRLLERTRVQTDNQRDVMVLIASVHPLRFGGCPAEPVLIGCADSTVDNPALDEALSARCNSF